MLKEFLNQFKSTILGTIDKNNYPFNSYSVFIKHNNNYYVYLSDMAKHAQNIKSNCKVSMFFIEDENKCENIFARKRVVFQAQASIIKRDSNKFTEILNEFEKIDKKTVQITRNMIDFNLFELKVIYGEAVFGFGKAYTISGEKFDKLIPKDNSAGHKHITK